ncbi:host attachment protein [Yoonia sediminilitoris]|uniref:Protein required for attachment to host cells n=1 Tax=Yoonia sediminilitoris TaxID=1286148 RepID=A0A2T6KIT2_9RHOB|nr:host attachment protein [Yoonia sediminilitoris]PUB15630.1 protein required for attachment to host cells [Yoonia sediminilitoris]RCW96239.1 protein required for attachment to host cells [Yoonia sediminilitoris]
MKKTKTWIVLADTSAVRIAVNDGPAKGVYGISTKELQAPTVTELSDEPGMTKAPFGPDRGNISDPDLKGQAAAAFATDIVNFLDAEQAKDSFQRLVLVAPPAMLGLLRDRLTPRLRDILRADIPKDLTHLPLDKLPAHLEDVLPV